jgi:hypothetical protein
MAIKHPFTSAKADGGDTTLVQPSNWNANHTIDAATITYAMIQNVTATDKLLGRSTAGAGVVEEIALTAAGRALIDDADATAQRTTLGLGTMATQASTAYLPITGGNVTGSTTITHSGTTGDALRITLSNASATGNALVVEDETNPDATPFAINTDGYVFAGHTASVAVSAPNAVTQTPASIQQNGTALATATLSQTLWGNGANGPAHILAKSRGVTIGSHVKVEDNDNLGFVQWQGSDGTNFYRTADIRAAVDGATTASSGIVPSSMSFRTTTSAGTLTQRLLIGANGNILQGTAANVSAAVSFNVNKALTGATTVYGILMSGNIATDVTVRADGFLSQLTPDASVTLTDMYHFRSAAVAFGAGAVVTNQYGFSVQGTTLSATNNFGFHHGMAAATGRWGFYGAGTADNAFAGNSRFGGVTAPVSTVDVTGTLATTGLATLNGLKVSTYTDIADVVTPAAPAAGNLRIFAKTRAARATLNSIGPSGIEIAYQPAFFGSTITMWAPSATTAQTAFGATYTARNSGTAASQDTPAQGTASAMLSMKRARFGTGTTATGASGTQTGTTAAWRGNAAGLGGFFFYARFGVETLAADQRVFIGLSANNATMAADASTWNNTVGLTKDSADSVWQLLTRNGTTATKTSSTCTVTAGQVLDLYIFAPPNGTDVCFRLTDPTTGTIYVDDVASTATLPVSTVFMYMQAQTMSVTGLTAKLLALNKMYLETEL